MQVRVTFSPCMNSVKAALKRGKSAVSRRHTRMFTTLAIVAPAAARTLSRLARVRRVCSTMSGETTSRVSGSSGPWPETNSIAPQRTAWASGEGVALSVNPVVGARAEATISLGIPRSFRAPGRQAAGITALHALQVRASTEPKNRA